MMRMNEPAVIDPSTTLCEMLSVFPEVSFK